MPANYMAAVSTWTKRMDLEIKKARSATMSNDRVGDLARFVALTDAKIMMFTAISDAQDAKEKSNAKD